MVEGSQVEPKGKQRPATACCILSYIQLEEKCSKHLIHADNFIANSLRLAYFLIFQPQKKHRREWADYLSYL